MVFNKKKKGHRIGGFFIALEFSLFVQQILHPFFGEQLENYLNNVLEATTPESAPNYDNLPTEDTSNPPTRTNHTTKPVYTEENP